jgi:hypothetical protein
MSQSYSHRINQTFPLSDESKDKSVITDIRLPSEAPSQFVNCTDFDYTKESIITPEFSVYSSGTDNKIRLSFMSSPNILADLSKGYLSYKIRIKKTATTYLNKTDAFNGTYAQFGALSSGALANSSTVKFIYIKNSAVPFSYIAVKDRDSDRDIERIEEPALYSQMLLSGQRTDFWSDDENIGLADIFGCGVHTFTDDKVLFVKSNNASATDAIPSHLLPLLEYGTGTTRNFTQVRRQQQLLWPSDDTCSISDGKELIFFPCSDFLNSSQLLFTNLNKITLELGINTYGKSITDVSNTLTTAATSIWAGAATNFPTINTFELYDIKFHVPKLSVNESVVAACLKTAQSDAGIRIPFVQAIHKKFSLPSSQTSLNLVIDDKRINDLQKVIICFRKTADCADNALYDLFAFRNCSDIEVAVAGSGVGSAATFAQLLAVSTGYNGLKKISCRFLGENVPFEPITVFPTAFDTVKKATASCFEDPSITNFKSYEYEGLADSGFLSTSSNSQNVWLNSNTQFIVGIDLRSAPAYTLTPGISISRGNFEITLDMNTSATTARSTDMTVDCYLICGSMFQLTTGGFSVTM